MARQLAPLALLLPLVAYCIYHSTRGDFATPESTLIVVEEAIRSGDLDRIADAGLRRELDKSIHVAGSRRYDELFALFDKARQLGQDDYRQFERKVESLGREAYRRLSAEEKTMVGTTIGLKLFMLAEGVKRLPPTEQAKIRDPNAFIHGREKDLIAVAEGLDEISHEEWEALKGYDYATLRDQKEAFIRREGKDMLRRYLEDAYSSVDIVVEDRLSAGDLSTSLFSPSRVDLEVRFLAGGSDWDVGRATVALERRNGAWLVEGILPPLF